MPNLPKAKFSCPDIGWSAVGPGQLPGNQYTWTEKRQILINSLRGVFILPMLCNDPYLCRFTGIHSWPGGTQSHGMNHFNTPLERGGIEYPYPALWEGWLQDRNTRQMGNWHGRNRKNFWLVQCLGWSGVYFLNSDSGKIHNSEWLAIKAREFLSEGKSDQPFCLTVCYKAPHHPYQPDARDSAFLKMLKFRKGRLIPRKHIQACRHR